MDRQIYLYIYHSRYIFYYLLPTTYYLLPITYYLLPTLSKYSINFVQVFMSLSFFDLLTLTYTSLKGNLLRSGLTSLGVFMGVTAVTSTLVVRNISEQMLVQQLQEREAPQLAISAGWNRVTKQNSRLTLTEMEFLQQRLSGWQSISASASGIGNGVVLWEDQKSKADAQAVSQEFLETSGRTLLKGRFFSQTDFTKYRPVVVIDETLEASLFKKKNSLTERLYLDGKLYFVVGVVETKKDWGESKGLILLPLSVYSAMKGSQQVEQISIRPQNQKDLEILKEQAEYWLTKAFPQQKFQFWTNIEDILLQQQIINIASLALLLVAAIALLVGGVGIANITIASVLERTEEIGLRRAIGATKQDIMAQFMLEATILSLSGGATALITVHGIAMITANIFDLPYQFNRHTAILALGSASMVGVSAGFFPALRASKLDPVKALRSE